jgi:hypothetical protein
VRPINNRDRLVQLDFAHISVLNDVDASAGN